MIGTLDIVESFSVVSTRTRFHPELVSCGSYSQSGSHGQIAELSFYSGSAPLAVRRRTPCCVRTAPPRVTSVHCRCSRRRCVRLGADVTLGARALVPVGFGPTCREGRLRPTEENPRTSTRAPAPVRGGPTWRDGKASAGRGEPENLERARALAERADAPHREGCGRRGKPENLYRRRAPLIGPARGEGGGSETRRESYGLRG